MKNLKIFIISIALLILSACSQNTPENIYSNKTEYLGDNTNVIHIVDMVEFPEGVNRKEIELLTENEPYTLIVNLEDANRTIPHDLLNNAAVYFSLIGNLSNVEFRDETGKTFAEFNREYVDDFLKGRYLKTSAEIGDNKDSFYEYIEKSRTKLSENN